MGISNSPIFKILHRQFIIDKKVLLTDLYVEKMRYKAVSCMSRSYRPTIPVSYIARVLGFCRTSDGNDEKDLDGSGLVECLEWMKAHGACLASDNSGEIQLDTKVSPI